MTLVIAARDKNGRTVIGADRRGSNGITYDDGYTKLIPQHNYVLGISGSIRVCQILKYSADRFGKVEHDEDMFRWTNQMRTVLGEYGFKIKSDGREEPEVDAVYLILAAPDLLYQVHTNSMFSTHDHIAIGSGDDYGLGFFDATTGTLDARISKAIKETAKIDPAVSPTIDLIVVAEGSKGK